MHKPLDTGKQDSTCMKTSKCNKSIIDFLLLFYNQVSDLLPGFKLHVKARIL